VREHDRLLLASELVAVEIDVDERVLRPEGLLLVERLLQRAVIPETDG